ncbi:hypothetical protein B0T24DRAFT_575348 [Lasiosphaeria ovina]|uniref:N-acetyltransferase domain-containing protein n=1 Tax=Lasiosphaeria ovina TaxID=92902 RepID=A0AAE0KAZ1_9PEZI|nr:hypothetical protein B0T24DRAFT_575348 [Lasiosphaeria ovina]
MAYRVVPCRLGDAEAIAVNNMTAFWDDITWRLTWMPWKDSEGIEHPGVPLEELIARGKRRYPWNLLKNRTEVRETKAVDENGKLVGFARWVMPEAHTNAWLDAQVPDASVEERDRLKELHASTTWNWRKDMNPIDDPVSKRQRSLTQPGCPELDFLAVHPDNARKGIATVLVRKGMQVAEELGIGIFMLAFNCGLNVYTRLGFQLVDQIIQDDTIYGGEGNYARYYLRLDPARKLDGEGNPEPALSEENGDDKEI